MKFCVSSRQQKEYLRKADEIRVEMRDHKQIPDLAEEFPEKDIILEWHSVADERITTQDIIDYNNLTRQHLIVCLDHLTPETDALFRKHNIRYFWGYDVTSTAELKSLKDFYNVCYVRIGAPLFFQMNMVEKFGIPIRVSPNLAHQGYFIYADAVNGTWIRPEDLHLYEPIVQAAEFIGVNLEQERALFRIYAEQKCWPGEVSMIITNLGPIDCMNRMLPEEFTIARMNCHQRCTAYGACRLCYRYFSLADPEKLRPYLDK